jgi:spore coat protein A
LRPVSRLHAASAVKTRTLTLNNYEDPNTHMMMMLLNATYWHQPVTEKPVLDSIEVWEFLNLTDDTHPIHLHHASRYSTAAASTSMNTSEPAS